MTTKTVHSSIGKVIDDAEKIQYLEVESLISWRRFVAQLEGVTPLLMHNPRGSMGKKTGALGRREIPSPEEEAAAGLYQLANGDLYIKADMVRESMKGGAKGLRIGKRSLSGLLGSVMIDEETFTLTRNGVPIKQYDDIDIRRVVVQKQGVMRARAQINCPWALEARFLYDAAVFRDADPILAALTQGGQLAGLGDYRAGVGGSHGRFTVRKAWTTPVELQ